MLYYVYNDKIRTHHVFDNVGDALQMKEHIEKTGYYSYILDENHQEVLWHEVESMKE